MTQPQNRFAYKLKRKLKEKNISQSELARRIDVTDTTVSRYIKGDAYPRPLLLRRIANVLDCSIEDLF